MADMLNATVVYADGGRQATVIVMKAAAGATLGDVIGVSGVLTAHPEIVLEQSKIGVWGKLRKASALVNNHDRIEIYRGLLAEPNATRLARAAKKKTTVSSDTKRPTGVNTRRKKNS